MNIEKAIKKSLIRIGIDPDPENTNIRIIEGVNPLLNVKEREKKYYKKTIKLDIHPRYYTTEFEKTLKRNIIRLTEYNNCWVKETGPNVFHILV